MTKVEDWKKLASNCQYVFPEVEEVETSLGDLVSIGADLEPETLIYAYSKGYFPMEVADENNNKILGWFSPIERGIFPLGNIRITKSMKQSYKKYRCGIDEQFENVMRKCMDTPRKGGWINEKFIKSYTALHNMGLAHSVEVYDEEELVGGLYGVSFAGFFAGESMFSTKRDASKIALMKLVEHLEAQNAKLLDAQWQTPHLESLGAIEVSRRQYLGRLATALNQPSMTW